MNKSISLDLLFKGQCMPEFILQTLREKCVNDCPLDLYEFTEKALDNGSYFIKIYAILCLIAFSKTAQEVAFENEISPRKAKLFYRAMNNRLLLHLHGLKANGDTYRMKEKQLLMMRRVECYAYDMMCVYVHL